MEHRVNGGDGRESVRTEYDWAGTDPVNAVIRTVAAAVDSDPTDIEPLYDFVDPDALNAFIQSSRQRDDEREASLSFPYLECQVTVWSGGEVVVRKDGL